MDPFSVDPFGDSSESRATVVGGRSVTVLKRLAEGGFGSVDLVRDGSSGQNIVLKTMMVMGDENTEQLMNEVKVMRALGSHPHIVRLLEAQSTRLASDKIKVEMLLENCPGGTLLDKLNSRSSALPLNQALGCFGQIVAAVAHMHKMSPPIAHRDLKLENVLIGADKKLRLCDFGSVSDRQGPIKDKRDRTDEQDRIERFTTPHFRAPEMVDLYSGHAIDERVDVWALGCLWHAVLFLSHPFQTTGVLAIVSATYTLPDEAASTPPICIELLRACLRIDPEERPTCEAILTFVAAASRAMKVGGGERALRQASTASKLRALLVSKAGKQCPTGEEQSATAAESAKGKGGRSRAHRAKAAAPSAVDAVLSLAQQGAQAGGGGSGSSSSSTRRTRGGRQIGGKGKGKQAAGKASKRGTGRPAASSAAGASSSAGGGDDGGSDWSPFGGDDSTTADPAAGKATAKRSAAAADGDGSDFDPFGDDGGDDPPASGDGGVAVSHGRDDDGDDFDPFGEDGGGGAGKEGDTQAGLQPPSDDEDEDDLFGSDAPSNASGGPGSKPKAAGGAEDEDDDDDDLFGGALQEGSGSSTAAVAPPVGSSAASTGALGSVGASSTVYTPRSMASGPGPYHASGASFASAQSVGGQSAAGYGGLKRFASTGMPIGQQQQPGMGGMGMGAGTGMGPSMGMGSGTSSYRQQAGVGYPVGMQSAGGLGASYGGMHGGGMGHRGAYSQQFASHSGLAGAGGYPVGMGMQQAMPQGGMMGAGAGAMHGRSASQGPEPTQPMSRDDVSRMLAQRSGGGSRPGTGT